MNSLKRDSLAANDVLLIRKVMEHVFQRLYKLADTLTMNGTLSSPPSPRSTSKLTIPVNFFNFMGRYLVLVIN